MYQDIIRQDPGEEETVKKICSKVCEGTGTDADADS